MMEQMKTNRIIQDGVDFEKAEQIEKTSEGNSLYIDNIDILYNNIGILLSHLNTLSIEVNKLSIEINTLSIEVNILNKKKFSIGENFFLDDNNNNIYNDIEEKEKRKYKKKKEKEDSEQDQRLLKFNLFWEAYDKKESRTICLNIWKKLEDEEIDTILKTVESYVRWKSDAQYRKMPSTYLRGRCWEDRIPAEFLQPAEPAQPQGYQLPKNAVY